MKIKIPFLSGRDKPDENNDVTPNSLNRDGIKGLTAIGDEEIAYATQTLSEYKRGKANLESRVVEDELWWELRHWEILRRGKTNHSPEPTSAWLFNSIITKHADMNDNIPEPLVLPREQSDEESADIISKVLPTVLEYNRFDDTYSRNSWEKLKHGTAPYGIFWDVEKENGLGDISIKPIDLLNIFWEPGITDIQKSQNLFIVDLVDEELLNNKYPQYKGKMQGNSIDVKQYIYDDNVDTQGKSVVVDWYYKIKNNTGRTVVHYVKYVGNVLLYSSQNDPQYQDSGWYEHGLYPVVFDTLFPEKGTPVGFGFVSVCKDPQMYIDKLSSNIMEASMMGTKKRYFASDSMAINEEEFLDWNKPIVHINGDLDDRRIKEIEVRPLDSIYVNIMQMKIEEMKETASNRDVTNGGTSNVTAAAGISALQEAGNKVSRDMISTSYNAYKQICEMCIELMRQFYDETRAFRITGKAGEYEFVDFNNNKIKNQLVPSMFGGQDAIYRKPIFDIKVMAQRKNPFSRMEQNERAKELYAMGFFNPEKAQESLMALDMMDFEGIDKIREQVKQGQTLVNVCDQLSQQIEEMKVLISSMQGTPITPTSMPDDRGGDAINTDDTAEQEIDPNIGKADKGTLASGIMDAQTPMTSYAQRLVKRSTPSVDTEDSMMTGV